MKSMEEMRKDKAVDEAQDAAPDDASGVIAAEAREGQPELVQVQFSECRVGNDSGIKNAQGVEDNEERADAHGVVLEKTRHKLRSYGISEKR